VSETTPATAHAAEHAHPGPIEYVKVAVFLAVVTGIEVAIYYVKAAKGVLAPVLIVLSFVKFGMVGLYFMHLKFERWRLRLIFIVPLPLAIILVTTVIMEKVF